jgi:cell division protein ZapA
MSAKTDAQVIIGGRVLTLSGYESEEYLQKVASYLNTKIADCSKIEGFNRQPVDLQSILLQLNIADDYFKAKKQIALLEEQATEKEKELYDLKHELIASQIKLENTEKNVKNLEKNLEDDSRKIIQLETELKNKVTPISSGSSSGKGRR